MLEAPSSLKNLEKIWNNDQKIAADNTKKNEKLNSTKPGLVIINTPEKPRIITNHLLIEIFSFNKKNPKTETMKGDTKSKAPAKFISKFFNPKKYKIDENE